jgi:hypothetical protein
MSAYLINLAIKKFQNLLLGTFILMKLSKFSKFVKPEFLFRTEKQQKQNVRKVSKVHKMIKNESLGLT